MKFDQNLIKENAFSISTAQVIDGQTAHEPDLNLAEHGDLWVTWCSRGRDGDAICAQRTDATARQKITVSSMRGVECQPCIISLKNGGQRIAWTAFREGVWHLLARDLHDSNPGDEKVLASHIDGIFHPRLLLAKDGTCYLVFENVIEQSPQLFMMREQHGTWARPEKLATPTGSCYRPSLASRADGSVWMAYDNYLDGHYRVWLQRIDIQSEAVCVSPNGYQNVQASLAAAPNGDLWIAWASNQNAAFKDRWWLTKWANLRRFDGQHFSDPVGEQHGRDVYNEDSFQGWEFPEVTVDSAGRVWLFGQSSHTLYAQYYAGDRWSELYTIAPKHWGTWKPRCRAAGDGPIFLTSMGLQGAQLQRIDLQPAKTHISTTPPSEPVSVVLPKSASWQRPVIHPPEQQALNVYFGDLHAHSIYGDACNDVDEFYHRYRDAYGYDFAALTEHDYLDGMELSQSELKMMWNHSDRVTRPGEFVAFYAYEWTSPALADHAGEGGTVGEGHRHILYRDQSGPLVSYGEASANTGKKLLARLQGQRALVIPHHTSWSGTDWDAHDENLQRLVEVCSTHGRFEYSGNQPIGYRRDHIHPGKFIFDALARGYRLGFVGGSDSHGLKWHATELEGRAKHIPAGTHVGWKDDAFRTGMTAILAPELTREALFDALHARRCYATSGVRIFVDFRINGALMGSDIMSEDAPHLTAQVRGTSAIRSVEVVRSGHVFAGVQSQPGEGLTEMQFALDDNIIVPGESHYYYLRVLQEDGNMAWSSPIWVRWKE